VADVAAVLNAVAGSDGGGAFAALRAAVAGPNLDGLLAAGRPVWDELRARMVTLLSAALETNLYAIGTVKVLLPFAVANYVDFYASENHATNVGRIFRPDQAPLTPNWKHLPIGCHGRAGTIVPSGTER
jgi:fumarylacetoacetase